MLIMTKHLVMRSFEMSDFEAVHRYTSMPITMQYMPCDAYSEADTREYLKKAIEDFKKTPILNYGMAVVLKENGQVIGRGTIHVNIGQDEAMVGWILHKEYWGRGLAAELAKALIQYCFETLHLHRVYALCHPDNIGSWKVMEKCKMRREAHFKKKRCRISQESKTWNDEYEYAILESEWYK